MIDYSFLRLHNNFEEAISQNRSKVIELNYVGQVHLAPGETYLQITNSPIALNFSNLQVHLVDCVGNEIKNVTNSIFFTRFLDTNGIWQIVWEFINDNDFGTKELSLRFREGSNGVTFWTNLFITTAYDLKFTSRLDYKNNGFHHGTQYNRADYYQSIRISTYYDIPVNESERSEYHQVSTKITVSTRNITKDKDRFVLYDFDHFTITRLEKAITSSELYVDGQRYFSTTPIEYPERQGNSNMFEGELILNPTQIFKTFSFQIFEGFKPISFQPFGRYSSGTAFEDFGYVIVFNREIALLGGTLSVYTDQGVLIRTITETDAELVNDFQLGFNVTAYPDLETPADGSYYVNISAGFVSWNGVPNEAITDSQTWTFTLSAPDFSNADYNPNDYLTN